MLWTPGYVDKLVIARGTGSRSTADITATSNDSEPQFAHLPSQAEPLPHGQGREGSKHSRLITGPQRWLLRRQNLVPPFLLKRQPWGMGTSTLRPDGWNSTRNPLGPGNAQPFLVGLPTPGLSLPAGPHGKVPTEHKWLHPPSAPSELHSLS